MNLLHLDSSVLGTHSASRELTAAIVAGWQDRQPGLRTTYRDLATDPLPHLDGAALGKADPVVAERAEQVLAEFLAADVIVVGAPACRPPRVLATITVLPPARPCGPASV